MIWNDKLKLRLDNAMLHHNVDYTPYEGIELAAWPEITISRGESSGAGRTPNAAKGRGQFLRCERPAPAKPRQGSASLPWLRG